MTVYSEFLASLRNNPSLVAEWLTLGDKLGLPYMKDMDDRVDGQRQQLLHKIDLSYKVLLTITYATFSSGF